MNDRTENFFANRLSLFLSGILVGLAFLAGITSVKGATAADFDGDGKADLSVFRPSDGFWHIAKSSGGFSSVQFGKESDALVAGDYDGDGRTDVAVYRRASIPLNYENIWYILGSSDNTFRVKPWVGNLAWWEYYSPVPADFDGDGRTDLAVYRLTMPSASRADL